MRFVLTFLIASLSLGPAFATEIPRTATVKSAKAGNPPDSTRLEADLQGLPWDQFKAVISAVPKMKADVDAYGAAGWQYVKARYKTHPWKKNIDRLDAAQKKQLADLIQKAKGGTATGKAGG